MCIGALALTGLMRDDTLREDGLPSICNRFKNAFLRRVGSDFCAEKIKAVIKKRKAELTQQLCGESLVSSGKEAIYCIYR
jgi:hypothetical protein